MCRFSKANQLNALAKPQQEYQEIELSKIEVNLNNARKEFNQDKLNELSKSIVMYGLLQPIIVTKKDDKFMIIGGERRYRASIIADLPTIKAFIVKDSNNIKEKNLIENLIREDLTDFETANAVNDIWDQNKYKSKQDLAIALNISSSILSKYFNIIKNLDSEVKEQIIKTTDKVSTSVMIQIAKKPKATQKKILTDYNKGDIKRDDISKLYTVKKTKQFLNFKFHFSNTEEDGKVEFIEFMKEN